MIEQMVAHEESRETQWKTDKSQVTCGPDRHQMRSFHIIRKPVKQTAPTRLLAAADIC